MLFINAPISSAISVVFGVLDVKSSEDVFRRVMLSAKPSTGGFPVSGLKGRVISRCIYTYFRPILLNAPTMP